MKGDYLDKLSAGYRELAQKYPWFDIPVLAGVKDGEALPRRLAIQAIWRIIPVESGPTMPCGRIKDEVPPIIPEGVGGGSDTMAIIDDFMSFGEHRITASEDTPDGFLAATEDELPPDELLTEELASIYLVQGLIGQAVEIYRRLSLLNPEKSVYFAAIIEKAQAAETAGADRMEK